MTQIVLKITIFAYSTSMVRHGRFFTLMEDKLPATMSCTSVKLCLSTVLRCSFSKASGDPETLQEVILFQNVATSRPTAPARGSIMFLFRREVP